MERVMGIEPTTSAWKAEVLPVNYTRIFLYRTFHKRTDLYNITHYFLMRQVVFAKFVDSPPKRRIINISKQMYFFEN